MAVELVVDWVVGFDVDVEVDVDVVVDVVCPNACNTAIKQITTAAVTIRFIAAFPLDNLICRPRRALGAIASALGPRRFPVGPGATDGKYNPPLITISPAGSQARLLMY